MPYFKSETGLILPINTGKIISHSNISLATVAKWRKQHVGSDLNSHAKDLYTLLLDMHQTPLSPKVRYEILILLQPNLGFLCEGLEKLYYRQEVLSENQRAIANLTYALNLEMLNAYKLVIHDAQDLFFGRRQLVLAATAHALHYCSKILFNAFEQHRDPPPEAWLEFHRLYQFANTKKILNTLLPPSITQSRFRTLADIYKHCLLFGLTNPHRLRKEQIAHLCYAIESWAPLMALSKVSTAAETTLFMVNMAKDAGPNYSVLCPERTDDCYYLTLNKVNQRLMRLLVQIIPTKDSKNVVKFSTSELVLPRTFLEHLLNSWQQIHTRRQERATARGYVTVCIGLSASFSRIQEQEANKSHTTQQENNPDGPNIETIDINTLPAETIILQSKTQGHPTYTCELIDKSEKGYCLKWLQEVPPQLLCGELIALRREHHPQNWEMGTIRWLKHEANNMLFFGVEQLSQDAIALTARLPQANYGVLTLAVPITDDKRTHLRLITPPLPFKEGQEIVLDYQDSTYRAQLQQTHSISPSYQEFSLNFIEEPLVFPRPILAKNAAALPPEQLPNHKK